MLDFLQDLDSGVVSQLALIECTTDGDLEYFYTPACGAYIATALSVRLEHLCVGFINGQMNFLEILCVCSTW